MKQIKLSITISLLLLAVMIISTSCAKDEGPFVFDPDEVINDIDTIDPIINDTDTVIVSGPTVFPYTINFGTDVKQILAQNCVQGCHNPSHADLDLRPPVSYAQLLTDGTSAPYVDTLNPAQSIIYLHLTGVYTLMPKDLAPLSQGKIDTIYTWISQGAKE